MTPMLVELRRAVVRFGAVLALDEIDFSLRAGERVALLGSNGSGKTTLLRLLHGLVTCTSGQRESSTSGAAEPWSQAMVFQRPFLLSLSVAHNLQIALRLAGVPSKLRGQPAKEALDRAGLAGLSGRPARTLSTGQQQRLALARAWAVRPRILYLDEPTASLDPAARLEVELLIGRFADEGMTLVFSTHNLAQAKRLATRVVYLDGGRLVVDLPAPRFFSEPLPDPAAQFLRGESP